MEIIKNYYKESVEGLNELILEDKDLWYSYIIHLPIHLQIVYTIVVFHQQLYNGGFHQYFFNSYGQFAYLTVEHLRVIKAYKTAEVLEKALIQVNPGYTLKEFREKIFNRKIDRIVNFEETLNKQLDDFDIEYDSLDENLEQLLINYLEKDDKI